jgi:uncharacterized LabA/DUF88 family protein
MKRVMVYIDGFNLYFGLRSKAWHRYYWLDLVRLAQTLLKPDQALHHVHYFTARLRANARNATDTQRQNIYLEALATLPGLQTHFGHYLEKPRSCKNCGAQWTDYEEKMTDVNIAVQMMSDAFANRFDTALLISADSDLTPPIRQLRSLFPDKRVIVVFPPNRRSFELGLAANGTFALGEAKLRQAQLPDEVSRMDGFKLRRPASWH